MVTEQEIKARAFEMEDWLRAVRRQLHRIPEPGFQEKKTSAFIKRTLEQLGIPYTSERTWVIGLIEGGQPGKTVALRADMDALPIEEKTGLEYASEHPGYMHACGHDCHTAMLLGAAKLLMGMREQLRGCVKLLFQPAEETEGGALPMIEAGCLEHPHVDAVYGLHVSSGLPVGKISTMYGTVSGSSDELTLEVFGKSGHGAHPSSGVDAIVISAQVISALQTLVSRSVSPTDAAVISIGSIAGGGAPNVICDHVVMRGTLRTITKETRELLRRRIGEVAQGVARTLGGDARLTVHPSYCALINHDAHVDRVVAVGKRLFGEESVEVGREPSLGVEDFAYFVEHAPGAFFNVGCARLGEADPAPGHNCRFNPDERCLPYGVAMHCALVWSANESEGE